MFDGVNAPLPGREAFGQRYPSPSFFPLRENVRCRRLLANYSLPFILFFGFDCRIERVIPIARIKLSSARSRPESIRAGPWIPFVTFPILMKLPSNSAVLSIGSNKNPRAARLDPLSYRTSHIRGGKRHTKQIAINVIIISFFGISDPFNIANVALTLARQRIACSVWLAISW